MLTHSQIAFALSHKHKIGRPRVTIERVPWVFMAEAHAMQRKGRWNVAALARTFRMSRPTAYKYLRLMRETGCFPWLPDLQNIM